MEDYSPNSQRYSGMNYRKCGNSGIVMPEISLGFWHNFGASDNIDTQKQIMFRAFDLGVNCFDLANNYGYPAGSAEENVGKILKKHFLKHRDELLIVSKAGHDMWAGPYGIGGSRKYLMSSLHQSLKRLNVEYVDIFYHHVPDPNTPLEETMKALADIVQQGKALYVGISKYSPKETRDAVALLKQYGVPCLVHQVKYNMLSRDIEDELLPTLGELGIGCVAFSPLAQGLLSDRYIKNIPEDSRVAKPHGFLQRQEVENSMATVRRLHDWAECKGEKLSQVALKWILRREEVQSVIIGASSVNQLNENLASLNGEKLSPQDIQEIDNILHS